MATTDQLTGILGELPGGAENRDAYWVLRQGPMNPGSLRESLVNLDSAAALSAALKQVFSKVPGLSRLVIQALPGRIAAGVLFTRHPVRVDLDHIIVEGIADGAGEAQERLILHADGHLAFHSKPGSPLAARVDTATFARLARQLRTLFPHPQAGEWIYDGAHIWLLQTLPVGSLPEPREAWCRRSGFGLWEQAITPLWYTLAGRWAKTGFWRPFGTRMGWKHLGNIEPYRRQYSHLYANSVFFRELGEYINTSPIRQTVPPAWRPVTDSRAAPRSWRLDRLSPWLTGLSLRWLSNRIKGAEQNLVDVRNQPPPVLWQRLMQLDALGEKLAEHEGWICHVATPRALASMGHEPDLQMLLSQSQQEQLQACLSQGQSGLDAALSVFGPGDDPVFPRNKAQLTESALLDELPGRNLALCDQHQDALPTDALRAFALRQQALALRRHLAGLIRHLMGIMAEQLVADGKLRGPDDVWFVYFDELWQLWMGQGDVPVSPGRLEERKLRYLTSAHQGAPDWVIDQVAYGVRTDQKEYPVLDGFGITSGHARGPVRRIYSGWGLNQLRAGDILVIDQSEAGWLPWLALAGGIVIANRDPLNPAAALARSLSIPAVVGVDDAMHCLVDGSVVEIDGGSGSVRFAE